MKVIRLPIQIVALFLQIYFFVETVRLYLDGYVSFMGDPIESPWFSMLFTLLIVVACEFLSFIDAVLFIISKHNGYCFLYLAMVLINAFLFLFLAYYSLIGTIVCVSFYAVLFILRIVNIILNLKES